MRRLWGIATILVFIGLSFWAGYISYPLIQGMVPPAAAAPELLPEFVQPSSSGQDDPHMRPYWEAWEILERDFYGPSPDPTARTYGAIRGLAESFNDPYTYFLEPQPRQLERDELRGRFGGIGANIERTEAGFILYPLFDQPAERAGIEAGDMLIQVDGVTIPPQMESDDIVARVRGPVGSVVHLVVRRAPADAENNPAAPVDATLIEHAFEIERAEIETPSMEWRLIEQCAPAQSPPSPANGTAGEADPTTCTLPGAARLGYIRHTLFSERSPLEMEAALEELSQEGAGRFILDLRGNPGGLVNSAVAVADLWLDGGAIYIEQRADGSENVTKAQAGEIAEEYPLVVIVDGASASASEIVAGALQDHDRATVIGERTFGKGSVQLIHELSDQSSIHVTNAEWYTPDRRRISPDGLAPDVIIEPGTDPLSQAVALLAAQMETE